MSGTNPSGTAQAPLDLFRSSVLSDSHQVDTPQDQINWSTGVTMSGTNPSGTAQAPLDLFRSSVLSDSHQVDTPQDSSACAIIKKSDETWPCKLCSKVIRSTHFIIFYVEREQRRQCHAGCAFMYNKFHNYKIVAPYGKQAVRRLQEKEKRFSPDSSLIVERQ